MILILLGQQPGLKSGPLGPAKSVAYIVHIGPKFHATAGPMYDSKSARMLAYALGKNAGLLQSNRAKHWPNPRETASF